MAPPANRRTGYSRRAQYSTFFAYVAGVIGVLAGALLLLGSISNSAAASSPVLAFLRGTAGDITAPLGRAVAAMRASVAQGVDVGQGFLASGSEVARLRKEVALARVARVETRAAQDENRRLKALLDLATQDPRPIANGWLISSSASSTRRYALVSAGLRDGVRPGMPVRTPEGLVGRVLEVGQVSARVLLITDTQSVVPVRRAQDGVPAFATGKGDGTLVLRLLTLAVNPLHVGDVFVTSGSGGIYWPGTPIAQVTGLTHDGATARVLGDPAASEMVAVLPAWTPTEDATLPPPTGEQPPAPKPTAKAKGKKGAKGAKPAASPAPAPAPAPAGKHAP
ncbi:MAG TPA: rod shape-determining protein MreC [Novosphingobium sp.]|nr:rod shape-determining protein MreC [Novosphingobium sp.]HZV11285.1 rod shape-determining protein MreC [Novosphingobium sp.]